MVVPAGDSAASRSAHASTPPPDVPLRMPSFCASSRATAIASLPPTCMSESIAPAAEASATRRGMKSGAQPCSKCGRHVGCASLNEPLAAASSPSAGYSVAAPDSSSGALSGSHTCILVAGDCRRSTRETPLSVPPVP